jgi:hypothetical protein
MAEANQSPDICYFQPNTAPAMGLRSDPPTARPSAPRPHYRGLVGHGVRYFYLQLSTGFMNFILPLKCMMTRVIDIIEASTTPMSRL